MSQKMHGWVQLLGVGILVFALASIPVPMNLQAAEPAKADAAASSPPARPEMPESKSGELLLAKKFKDLDAIAKELRTSRAKAPSGDWRLFVFYEALVPAYERTGKFDKAFANTHEWVHRFPESVTALIAEADAYTKLAWAYRGKGFSNTVTDDGRRNFTGNLELAMKSLRAAEKLDPSDPRIYEQMVYVGLGLELEEKELEAFVEKGRAAAPDYFGLYTMRAFSLLPRWSGDPAAAGIFAASAAASVPAELSDEVYARTGWKYLSQEGAKNFNESGGFDVSRMRRGFDLILSRWPDDPEWKHRCAKFFVAVSDREALRKLFEVIQYADAPRFWSSEEMFNGYRNWARGEGPFASGSVLGAAAAEGDADAIEAMVKRGVAEEVTNAAKPEAPKGAPRGAPPLILAISEDQTEAALKLIEMGAVVKGDDGVDPLQWAVFRRNHEVIRALVKRGADVNKLSLKGLSHLYGAANAGDEETALLLLTLGADPNLRGPEGWPPLPRMAQLKMRNSIAAALKAGADPNWATPTGNTALHMAAGEGDLEAIDLLHEAGANPNIQTPEGITPLGAAVQHSKIGAVQALLAIESADANLGADKGVGPLALALRIKADDIAALLLNRPGINVNIKDANGYSALSIAASQCSLDNVKRIVELGGDLKARDRFAMTPYGVAKYFKRPEIADYLKSMEQPKTKKPQR